MKNTKRAVLMLKNAGPGSPARIVGMRKLVLKIADHEIKNIHDRWFER